MKLWLSVVAIGLSILLLILIFIKGDKKNIFTTEPTCAGCHLKVVLQLDGPATAGLSKGVHSIRKDTVQHPFFHTESSQCLGCHEQTHNGWKSSAHGRAFTNEIFQHAFKRDQKAWCLNCHAPLWDPETMNAATLATNPDFNALYAEGVNCVSCHVRNGTVIGPTDYSGKQNDLFHPVEYDPKLSSETFCAGCHQFNFVKKLEPFVVYESDHYPMQNTVEEYRQWKQAFESTTKQKAESCADCHFDKDRHGLGSSKSEQFLEVKINTEQGPASYKLSWHINIPEIGHHFPTGDLFRIVSLYAYNSAGQKIHGYDFRKEVRVLDRKIVQDTTLKPLPGKKNANRYLAFDLAQKPVHCEVVYRLQGNIEPSIMDDFQPETLRTMIYSGPCRTQRQITGP